MKGSRVLRYSKLGAAGMVASLAVGSVAEASPFASSPGALPTPAGQVIQVTTPLSRSQLMALPDATVLVGPRGERVTAEEAKRKLGALSKLSQPSVRPTKPVHARSGQRAREVATLQASENALAQGMFVAPRALGAGVAGGIAANPGGIGPGVTRGGGSPGVLRKAVLCPVTSPPSILGVNGRDKGITFTPGARYVITGCTLGDVVGRVAISGTSTTGQVQAVDLKVISWGADAVVVEIDAGLSGVGDIAAAKLLVNGRPGMATLTGQRFLAARDLTPIPIAKELVELNMNGNWRPRYDAGIASRSYLAVKEGVRGNGSKGGVGEDDTPEAPGNKFCSPWVTAVDHFHAEKLAPVLAAQGFELDSAAVDDLTSGVMMDDSNSQAVSLGAFASAWNGDELDVTPHGHSIYVKEQFLVADAGYSVCQSRYRVVLFANGPKGVTPHL